MSSRDRPKRPELDRSQPIRNWSTLFGPPTAPKPGSPVGNDAVSSGVETGYRVIDEYVRQGQEFAQKVWAPLGSVGGLGADPQKLTERMFQSASDLASGWLQFMQTAMPTAPFATATSAATPPRPEGPVGGFDIGSSQPAGGGVKQDAATGESASSPVVSVEIDSKKRAELFVDLKPGAAQLKLAAHDLRATDSTLPRIGGIVCETHPSENRVAVRVKIPPKQPAGTYSGLVVDDATNLPRGTLSVRVFD